MNDGAVTSPNIERAEHDDAGSAKRVMPVGWNAGTFTKLPTPFVDIAFDYISFTNADANGNYQTWSFKSGGSGGTTVRTLSVTYDGSNNITSIGRS
jgi:hypothetical protein